MVTWRPSLSHIILKIELHMGTRSGGRRTSKTGRIRALGNIGRMPSGKVKPQAPQSPGKSYHEKFQAAFKRTEARRKRREEHARYLQEKDRKSGASREENRDKANADRARVRAEREAKKRS